MFTLRFDHFDRWMTEYGRASIENDPFASAALFSLNARYYESPHSEPITGRDAIYAYWDKGAKNLRDKSASYEILAIRDNVGIARWQAVFTVIESGKRMELDCLFVVEFDDEGLCLVFREWWHIREGTA